MVWHNRKLADSVVDPDSSRLTLHGMSRSKNSSDGCFGCLALVIVAPLGYLLWQTMGGWVAVGVCVVLVGLLGLAQEQLTGAAKLREYKRRERERIRDSELKQQAGSEVVRELGKRRKTGNSRSRATIPGHIMQLVFDRDGGKCVLCGSTDDLQFDHILHHSKGGADSVENLRLLCRTCNQRRGNRFS